MGAGRAGSARAGREERFRAASTTCYVDLLRFVERRSAPGLAEDVVADVLLVAWRRVDELPVGDRVRPWLFGLAREVLLSSRRRRPEALAVRLAAEPAPPTRATRSTRDETGSAGRRAGLVGLAEAWPRLRTSEQEVLSLTVLDDLSVSEAATVLQVSPLAYRVRLMRARRSLRSHLGDARQGRGPDRGGRHARSDGRSR